MSNRLAELEQHIIRRTAKGPAMPQPERSRSTLQRTQQPMPAQVPSPPASGLSAKVSRWPSRRHVASMAARRAQAYSAIRYDVPGTLDAIAQPSGMSCWATVFTMLKSWRNQQAMSIEDALRTVGQRWVDVYRADSGLSREDKTDFLSLAGLAAEPPQNFTVEGWEQLLRNYGPIWITTDEGGGIHARIVTGIHGDGTAENTQFKIIDPNGGRRYEESIAVFIPKFEAEAISTSRMRIQVVHWQSDARSEQRALSFGRASSFQGSSKLTAYSRGLDHGMVARARQHARALNAIDVRYNVQLVPQSTEMSCWAAGFAMIVGWRDQISIAPEEIARGVGYWEQFKNGLGPEDRHAMSVWGLVPEAPQTFTAEGFANLLSSYGPLWVASAEPGPHIRVVTGMQGDGTGTGTLVHVNDPWEQGMTTFRASNRGSQHTETYQQFVEKQSTLGRQEAAINAPIYVAHLPALPSWMNSSTAKSFSHFVGRSIAMEAPGNPENFRLLTSGVWNRSTSLTVRGGQAMWFKIRNNNALGTTIRIREQSGQVKQSIVLPMSSVEFVFSIFGVEPMGWRFDIGTDSDVFLVTWELWSTWVPGMQSHQEMQN